MSLLLLLQNGKPKVASVAVLNEFPPDRLALLVSDPKTGRAINRWAEDEANSENVLSGVEKSGDMPGGHRELKGGLARDPRRDYPDLEAYLDLELQQPGGENVWEGRVARAQKTDGERQGIDITGVGHREALEDRSGLVVGFIDSDLSKWTDPSTQRKIYLGESVRLVSAQTGWQGTGEQPPGVLFDFKGVVTLAEAEDRGEAYYYGGGADIGVLLVHFKRLSGTAEEAWTTVASLVANDYDGTLAVPGVDHDAETDAAEYERVETAEAGHKYARLTSAKVAVVSGNQRTDSHLWEEPKVMGTQGLALQGTWPEVGFTAKQMLEWAVPTYTYLEANDESLDDDGFIIPQAWFGEPTDMATIVKELTKYGLYDYFVLNGKLFEMRRPGTYGRKWQASAGPSELKETGIDGTRLWRTIVVRWQDTSGRTLTAGPPGSGCDVEAAGLEVTDPEHPAVKAGITREDVLDLQGISETEFAVKTGERWLVEANELSSSGEATLKGYILDDKSVFRPVAQIMPGDQIRFPDAGTDTSYRKIVDVTYDHESRTATVTLDAPKESIEALLNRYRALLSARGVA